MLRQFFEISSCFELGLDLQISRNPTSAYGRRKTYFRFFFGHPSDPPDPPISTLKAKPSQKKIRRPTWHQH